MGLEILARPFSSRTKVGAVANIEINALTSRIQSTLSWPQKAFLWLLVVAIYAKIITVFYVTTINLNFKLSTKICLRRFV